MLKVGGDLGQDAQYFGDVMAKQEQYASKPNDEVGESKQERSKTKNMNQLEPSARGRPRRAVAGALASAKVERKDSLLYPAESGHMDEDLDRLNDMEEENK